MDSTSLNSAPRQIRGLEIEMQIAPTKFLAAMFEGRNHTGVLSVLNRALYDVCGSAWADDSCDVDWTAFSARALAILDEGDAEAEAARKSAASGEFALADLFPPASGLDRAELNSDVVAGLKAISRTLGASII